MAVDCATKCAKFILVIFNGVLLLDALLLMIVGLWFAIDPNINGVFSAVQFNNSTPLTHYAAYLFIAVGAFVVPLSLMGFCGAAREDRAMLGWYLVLLIIPMVGEAAAGGIVIFRRANILQNIEPILATAWHADPLIYRNKTLTDIGAIMAYIQYHLQCCGIYGPLDYQNWNGEALGYPVLPTCCHMNLLQVAPMYATPQLATNWTECVREVNALGLTTAATAMTSIGSTSRTMYSSTLLRTATSSRVAEVGTTLTTNSFSKTAPPWSNETVPENATVLATDTPVVTTTSSVIIAGSTELYMEGCLEPTKLFIDQWVCLIIAIGISSACLEILGILYALCLCRNIVDD